MYVLSGVGPVLAWAVPLIDLKLFAGSVPILLADCKRFVINASDSFKVNAGRIDLN